MKGLWYETASSLGLPFDLNQSLLFQGLSLLDEACSFLGHPYFDVPLLFRLFVGKRR